MRVFVVQYYDPYIEFVEGDIIGVGASRQAADRIIHRDKGERKVHDSSYEIGEWELED